MYLSCHTLLIINGKIINTADDLYKYIDSPSFQGFIKLKLSQKYFGISASDGFYPGLNPCSNRDKENAIMSVYAQISKSQKYVIHIKGQPLHN